MALNIFLSGPRRAREVADLRSTLNGSFKGEKFERWQSLLSTRRPCLACQCASIDERRIKQKAGRQKETSMVFTCLPATGRGVGRFMEKCVQGSERERTRIHPSAALWRLTVLLRMESECGRFQFTSHRKSVTMSEQINGRH